MIRVPKKARFFVSSGLSGEVHSVTLSKGSLSPVKGELSTFISLERIILKSAGTLSPIFNSTMSPGTSFSAVIYFFSPLLITIHDDGSRFLNPSISASDFAVYWNVIPPVSKMIPISTHAKIRFEVAPYSPLVAP